MKGPKLLAECEPGANVAADCPTRQYNRVRNIIIALAVCFVLASIAGLAAFQYNAEALLKDQIVAQARAHAREFEAVRLYVSSFGGIYVPASAEETANAHLGNVPGHPSVVTGSDGTALVLRNSPLVASSISDFLQTLDDDHAVKLRMASERPLNESNLADEFERDSLARFRADTTLKEHWAYTRSGDTISFRYAAPIIAKQPCASCHPELKSQLGTPFAVNSVNMNVTSAIERVQLNRWWVLAAILTIALAAFLGIREIVMRILANLRDSQLRLFELSRTDALTGLANSRLGLARLAEEIAREQRDGQGLAVAVIDLDQFKQINDTMGHGRGDEALKVVARTLRDHSRLYDTVARTGGEEFLVIFAGADRDDAAEATERIRCAITDALRASIPEIAGLGASAGVAVFAAADTQQSLLNRADSAMYEAKRRGKNRTFIG